MEGVLGWNLSGFLGWRKSLLGQAVVGWSQALVPVLYSLSKPVALRISVSCMLAPALEFPTDIPSTVDLYNLLWPPPRCPPVALTEWLGSSQPVPPIYAPPLFNQLHVSGQSFGAIFKNIFLTASIQSTAIPSFLAFKLDATSSPPCGLHVMVACLSLPLKALVASPQTTPQRLTMAYEAPCALAIKCLCMELNM